MKKALFLLFTVLLTGSMGISAQTTDGDDDVWREVDLQNVEYKKVKSYCQRLICYYRYIDDGINYVNKGNESHEFKFYRVNEGICELDVRYTKDADDGAVTLVGRNLVHPNKKMEINMEYYELTPYTFLEKARRDTKNFTLKSDGDITRIYTKKGLIGTAVRDDKKQELRIDYNALAPDTSLTLNILVAKGHLSKVNAKAVYRLEDEEIQYVPQGDLKHIVFEGKGVLTLFGKKAREDFHERTELYVDSVAYLTKAEYKADKKLSLRRRRARSGYTDADIDRLKQKHGVPPLTAQQLKRIEDQRDWDDAYEHWKATNRKAKSAK
jgi:hypothetical protein